MNRLIRLMPGEQQDDRPDLDDLIFPDAEQTFSQR